MVTSEISVAVAGASGYVGAELLRTLLGHGDVSIGVLTADSNVGQRLGSIHPHLIPLADRTFAPTDAEQLRGHDVVFLALPHGTSAQLAAQLDVGTLVIDCGADFRLESSADWAEFYGGSHAGTWPYGLPELPGQREKLTGSRRIAVPGCFPTVSTLTVLPALLADLIEAQISVVALTGTSGAGRKVTPELLGSQVMGQASAYAVGGIHRHTPEIEQSLRVAGANSPVVSFTPVLAPMSRGILATVSAPLRPEVTAADVRSAYLKTFGGPGVGEAFVQVLQEGQWPQTKSVLGANLVQVQATADPRADRLIAIGAMDNLAKGTAGGAIQSMNIALGIAEGTGLTTVGVAP